VSYVDKDALWWGKAVVLCLENDAPVAHQIDAKNG